MQLALEMALLWRGWGVNPGKSLVKFFTSTYKQLPLCSLELYGMQLEFNKVIHFLESILNRKLSWKPRVLNWIKKRSLLASTLATKYWADPMSYWISTAAVEAILNYGCFVWWKYLEPYKTNTAETRKSLWKIFQHLTHLTL